MRAWHFVILLLGGLAATGCRSDPNVAIVERELRLQEDKIYQLQDCIDEQRSIIESCRRENSTLHKRLQDRNDLGSAGFGETSPLIKPPRPDASLAPPADLTKPLPESPKNLDPDQLAPPSIQLPDMPGPSGTLPESLKIPPGIEGLSKPISGEKKNAESASPTNKTPTTFATGHRIEKIVLKRLLTGGYNSNLLPGDEGISAVIQLQDTNGNIVSGAAPISVVVLDPAMDGEGARIARWDFTANEVNKMYRKTPLAEGFHLEMMWPGNPPKNSNLHLFVRYTTPDGRKLETNRSIKVALIAQKKSNWQSIDAARSEHQPARRRSSAISVARRQNVPHSLPKIERPVWSPNR